MKQETEVLMQTKTLEASLPPKPLVIAFDRPKRALTPNEERLVLLWNNAPQIMCHTNKKPPPDPKDLVFYKKVDLGGSALIVMGWASFLITLSNIFLSNTPSNWFAPLWAIPVLVLGVCGKSFAQKKQENWKKRQQDFVATTPISASLKERISHELEEIMIDPSFEDAPVSYQQIIKSIHKSCLSNNLPLIYWNRVESHLGWIKEERLKNQ